MITCPYCHQPAVFVDSAEVYRRSYGMIYLCRPCRAWVGVHDGTDKPLGRLADAELREWKILAHAAFDPYWQNGGRGTRRRAYAALAATLGLSSDDCHIGLFDVDLCRRVVLACEYDLLEMESPHVA